MSKVSPMPRPRGRPPSGESAKPSSVQALDRALALLEIVAGEDGMTLTDVAARAEMAPSTAHRLLTTLQARRFVQLDPETGHWQIGVKAFQIGSAFARNRRIVVVGRRVMRELMERTGETVNLAIEDGGEVVFIAQFETHSPIRAFFRPGQRGPIHASGIGKALLATWAPDRVRTVAAAKGLPRFTDSTIGTEAALMADLERIRARGWSIDDGEHTLGMRCVAAPVFNEYAEAVAGISVSGPEVRMTPARLDELGPQVRRAAAEITASIGGVTNFFGPG